MTSAQAYPRGHCFSNEYLLGLHPHRKAVLSLIAQAQRQDKLNQWQVQQRQMELNSVQAQLDALVVKAPYSGRVRRIRWLEQVSG